MLFQRGTLIGASALALLIPTAAGAQGVTREYSFEVTSVQVNRVDAPPFIDPPFEPSPGTISDQVQIALPPLTFGAGDVVIVKIRFRMPVDINVGALQDFGVDLQSSNPVPGNSIIGTEMVDRLVGLSGLNLQSQHTPLSGVGSGIAIYGSDPERIYYLDTGVNVHRDTLAIDPGKGATLTGLEFRFQVPTSTSNGTQLLPTQTLQDTHLYLSAAVNYVDSSATIPALLAAGGTTATGSGVTASPVSTLPDGSLTSVSLMFDHVLNGGVTSLTSSEGGVPPPSGFTIDPTSVYYDITTTAQFSGDLRVCLNWAEGQVADESAVNVFHYDDGQWLNITDPFSRDPLNNIVCGVTTSLSPFALFTGHYPFTGFYQPVDNAPVVNRAKAGSAIPVKFSLGGFRGFKILATGYPASQPVRCDTGAPIAAIEETVNAGSSGLSFDQGTNRYHYVWKTSSLWSGGCRQLLIGLNDGRTYAATFLFVR